jgi:hypothetical protein
MARLQKGITPLFPRNSFSIGLPFVQQINK